MSTQPVISGDTTRRSNPFRAAPNILTLLRICLAPFLVAAILEDRYALSFGLFVAAGLTDALDGTLARLLKQRTMLGQYLDPVADKLLLSTLFLVLTHNGLIPARVTVLVFGRDVGILVVAAILYAAVGRREFRPSIFGKANTLVQIAAVAAVLLQPAHSRLLGCRIQSAGTRSHHCAYGGVGPPLRMGSIAPRRSAVGRQSRSKISIQSQLFGLQRFQASSEASSGSTVSSISMS